MASSTPTQTDTRNVRWKKVLNYYQNQSGALAKNNWSQKDSLRSLLVKVLKSIKKI